LVAGQDVLAARPTLLLALALEGSTPAAREELLALLHGEHPEHDRERVVARVRHLYTVAGAFTKAEKLVEKFRARAEALADEAEGEALRRLLYYLIASVLERPQPAPEPEPLSSPLLSLTLAR